MSLRLDRFWIVLAIVLLGCALQVKDGFYSPFALTCLVAAVACAVAAFFAPSRGPSPAPAIASSSSPRTLAPSRTLVALLVAGLALDLALLLTHPPGYYLEKPRPIDHPLLIALLLAAALWIVLIVRNPQRTWRVWFPALLVTAAAMGHWMIEVSPSPHIDVLTVHKFAIAALRGGYNPYAINFPNIYPDNAFYAPELAAGGSVLFGLPYPPLSLFMAVPGQVWMRDIRYAELACLLAGAAFIGYSRRTIVAPLAAAALLLTPRVLFVVEQGWTEPFAIVWLAATIFAAYRLPRALPWTLALLVSVKQHMLLAVPFALLMLPQPIDWRAAVRVLWPSIVVPIALALPFVVWDAHAFFHSVVWLQLMEPFRADSLSLLSALADAGVEIRRQSAITLIAPLLALAAAFALAWHRAPRTPAGFAASLGLTLLLVFAVSKKAFCNYYFFVIAAFCAALAAQGDDAADVPSGASRDDGAGVRSEL